MGGACHNQGMILWKPDGVSQTTKGSDLWTALGRSGEQREFDLGVTIMISDWQMIREQWEFYRDFWNTQQRWGENEDEVGLGEYDSRRPADSLAPISPPRSKTVPSKSDQHMPRPTNGSDLKIDCSL